MEFLIPVILTVGFFLIAIKLDKIHQTLIATREHTHNSHMRLIQISQDVDTAVKKYTYKY